MMSEVSLIPYLEPGDGKFCLNIVPPGPSAESKEYSPYPFQLLNDTDPFSRLFKAELVSGGGESGPSFFLLVQRDSYRYKADEIWSIGNPDLDKCWQQAFSYVSSKDNLQNRFFPLKDTTSPDGRLIPFRSLFFCTHTKRFFHPPCPICGKPLELCRNDRLLSSKGLMAYGTTLKRYLFCPSCPQDGADVFAYPREDTDPPVVKAFHELTRSWRNIVNGGIDSGTFPCSGCPEQAACYGEPGLSGARIVPFIFYPSYILAFEADSMSALDFLPLISGAGVDEIIPLLEEKKQYGRRDRLLEWRQIHGGRDLFLYGGKTEQFLEILYLKLSFLGDIARKLLSPGEAPLPADISTLIDCIWVNFPNRNSLLPDFWSFGTDLFTVGSRGTEADDLPMSHPSQTCYCLGVVWFFALLRNKSQSIRTVKEALKRILEHPADSGLAYEIPALAPENIFWNPDARRPEDIPAEWRKLWADAIALGALLLQGNHLEKAMSDGNGLFADLEKTRQEIKRLLFYTEKRVDTTSSGQTADARIYDILSGMLEKWQADTRPAPPAPQTEEDTMTETVILSANNGTGFAESIETIIEKAGPMTGIEEELQETVILKKADASAVLSETIRKKAPPPEATGADENDDMPETLILKPSSIKDGHK